MAESKPKRSRARASTTTTTASDPAAEWRAEVQTLSFNEARIALELAMAKLQSNELEVEEMASLYRRAEAYAQRCRTVLESVEQDVIEWDTPTC
jgi:exodeoxyribonuclease VII small subunit